MIRAMLWYLVGVSIWIYTFYTNLDEYDDIMTITLQLLAGTIIGFFGPLAILPILIKKLHDKSK